MQPAGPNLFGGVEQGPEAVPEDGEAPIARKASFGGPEERLPVRPPVSRLGSTPCNFGLPIPHRIDGVAEVILAEPERVELPPKAPQRKVGGVDRVHAVGPRLGVAASPSLGLKEQVVQNTRGVGGLHSLRPGLPHQLDVQNDRVKGRAFSKTPDAEAHSRSLGDRVEGPRSLEAEGM